MSKILFLLLFHKLNIGHFQIGMAKEMSYTDSLKSPYFNEYILTKTEKDNRKVYIIFKVDF